MTRLRKDQAEDLLRALDSATSGPLEEITIIRARVEAALRLVLDSPSAAWAELLSVASDLEGWDDERTDLLRRADAPDLAADPEAVLWALWDLVTELNERRTLG